MHDPTDAPLERIISMLAEFSQGNFRVREQSIGDEDPLNAVIAGLNRLGADLETYRNELLLQRTFVSNVLSNIDEVIYVRDIDLNDPFSNYYSFVSGRSLEIIGLSSEALHENPSCWSAAIHPEDASRTAEMFNRVLVGQESVVTYRMYHRGKGEYRWIEDRISVKLNVQGHVKHIYGSARDVTEQHGTILELEKTSQLVTRLITSSDQVFYIVSLDQADPFKNSFTYLSSHVQGIIGYSVEDVRNDPLTWINAVHPDDIETVKATMRDMFKSKSPGTRVYRMRHKLSGEYVWLEDYVVPIMDEKGWIIEFYASARDITARRTAELEREKLIEELSRKNDELMQFSHIVSHNLRAPVASLLGLAQILNDDPKSEELVQTTQYVLQSAQAMDGILRDLNTVLSVRSTLDEKMETFLLSDVLHSVCVNLKSEIDESGTILNIIIEDSADELKSIKSYMQSVLFNLIANAIKYRSPARTALVNIGVNKLGNRTLISIQDNGLGIDLDLHRDRIFVLYGRLHHDRVGKGLGLYMTKTQVEALNGSIDVQSQKGTGSIFTITI
jgi:PAS domain S-box-containing protein